MKGKPRIIHWPDFGGNIHQQTLKGAHVHVAYDDNRFKVLSFINDSVKSRDARTRRKARRLYKLLKMSAEW